MVRRSSSGAAHVDAARHTTHLIMGRIRQANTTGRGDSHQSRRCIDAVAHEAAIVLHDYVTEIDADTKLDALVGRQTGVAVSYSLLHFDRRPYRIHNRGELDQEANSCRLDDPPAMGGDHGIDQILRSFVIIEDILAFFSAKKWAGRAPSSDSIPTGQASPNAERRGGAHRGKRRGGDPAVDQQITTKNSKPSAK
jgi:hypothetical protein